MDELNSRAVVRTVELNQTSFLDLIMKSNIIIIFNLQKDKEITAWYSSAFGGFRYLNCMNPSNPGSLGFLFHPFSEEMEMH